MSNGTAEGVSKTASFVARAFRLIQVLTRCYINGPVSPYWRAHHGMCITQPEVNGLLDPAVEGRRANAAPLYSPRGDRAFGYVKFRRCPPMESATAELVIYKGWNP